MLTLDTSDQLLAVLEQFCSYYQIWGTFLIDDAKWTAVVGDTKYSAKTLKELLLKILKNEKLIEPDVLVQP